MANRKILLGLTTITDGAWKDKVKEIDELGIKEIALFPTCLDLKQRQELYKLLEKTGLKTIPHVHLREEDMEAWELDYLIKKYKVEVFNMHASSYSEKFIIDNKKFSQKIFIENVNVISENFEKLVKLTGGLCLDLSHWEDYGALQKVKDYEKFSQLVKKYQIGLNHVSAIKQKPEVYHDKLSGKDYFNFNNHELENLSEFDYVKKYKDYLAEIICLELENPLKRQLVAKKYLEKILDLS